MYGVPQGSVLGPLLFLLYINDLLPCCNEASFVLYADDTNIFVSASSYEEAVKKANEVLNSVSRYMLVNQLHINLSRSYFVTFTKYKLNCSGQSLSYPQLKINNTVIKEVEEIKFLGILLDKKLTLDHHINYLCKKLSCCIGTLKRMRHFIPEELKLSLYHTLFESHLVYRISVWSGIGNAKLEKIFIVQKRCIRMLFGDYNRFLDKFMTCATVRHP